MLPLGLPQVRAGGRDPLTVLCLGAHADDIEIGCGGTVLRLAAETPGLAVRWVVFSGDRERQAEARLSASSFLDGIADTEVRTLDFRESFFPANLAAIKEEFEALKDLRPDLILTHHKLDHHQDHRVVAELTWNTFRDHLILEYEIPKYDGDLGNPNLFVPLPSRLGQRKVEALMHHFPSQRQRQWFSPDTFLGLMRLRGIQCNAAEGLAEAFHCPKAVLGMR